jgi:hypothetical protein
MPRYFFHLCRDGTRFHDRGGQELDDADQAWEAARMAALGLMNSEANATANWSSCRFEVTNEHDDVLLEFPFLEAVEMKSQPN